jgi:hypothetical protein
MAQLYLSQTADRQEHAEVELFLEGYHDDLHVLQLKVAALFDQVSLCITSPPKTFRIVLWKTLLIAKMVKW